MRMAPTGIDLNGWLATREWHYLKGLGGVDLLEVVCHWGHILRCQGPKPGPVSPSSCRSR